MRVGSWPGNLDLPLLSLVGSEERAPDGGIARDLPAVPVGLATDHDPGVDFTGLEVVHKDPVAHPDPPRGPRIRRIGRPPNRADLAADEPLRPAPRRRGDLEERPPIPGAVRS